MNKQVTQLLSKKLDVTARVNAANLLAALTESPELEQAQASLSELSDALVIGDKTKLTAILARHSVLLDSLSVRLLTDANQCQNTKLTITIIELALKSFDCTRRTILAANELASTSSPLVAIQING
jgi:hypothetical protein